MLVAAKSRRFSSAAVVCSVIALIAGALTLVGCGRRATDSRPDEDAVEAIRIGVQDEGMYQIGAADLAKFGWEEVEADSLRLSHQGTPQPIWVWGEGEELRVVFYGQPPESRYTLENSYLLERSGAGESWMAIREATASENGEGTTNTFRAVTRVEENQVYFPRSKSEQVWFWKTLAAPQSESFEVRLRDIAPGQGRLRVVVGAKTEAPIDPDHHLQVLVNETLVADETWDGLGTFTLEGMIPEGSLKEGVNQVRVEAPGDTGVPADITLVDWIEVVYSRATQARDNRLVFRGEGDAVTLQGFKDPVWVFDTTDPQGVSLASLEKGEVFRATRGHEYMAVGEGGWGEPASLSALQLAPDLRDPANEADYIAIGPPDLLEALGPLLDWREEQGLKVKAVPVQAVYDQFNGGMAEPEAIRVFLKTAAETWARSPTFLLLVGDGSYDPQGYVAPAEANRLPSFFVQTVYGGETVSDVRFALLDSDPYPDMAVGRIPARTPEQVRIAVEKTLGYEQNPPQGDWQRRILAVADGESAFFQKDAERFLGHFPQTFDPVLYAPKAGSTGASGAIEAYLEQGALIMSYFGHGSITQLGKDRIFTTEDGAELANGGRLPVMVNLTCLAGLFSHPEVESLAETMLWNERGGAIAALAATSLTLPQDQAVLSEALVTALVANPEASLGEVVLAAQRDVTVEGRPGVREVLETFLLFGDPALRLP